MKMPNYKLIIFLLPLVLTACATYRPLPLPGSTSLATEVPRLSVEAEQIRVPGIKPHPFDPSDGLDIIEVAMLAVANNPQLKAARANVGIGRAQMFAAGLLPDPEFGLGLQHPINGGSSLVNAMSLALNYPLRSLVEQSAKRESASSHLRQLDMEVLWQEWQVVQRSRILYVRLIQQKRLIKLLKGHQKLLRKDNKLIKESVRSGNMTIEAGTNVLSALLSINTRLSKVERIGIRTRATLIGLLGLDHKVKLVLADYTPIEVMEDKELNISLTTIAEYRPDLLALRAGYESEDSRLRKAILGQFPGLSVGISRARDTDGINTVGVGITLRLPFFNGNRGAIAIEEATRDQLRSAYQARLAEAFTEVYQLRSEKRLLENQLQQARSHLLELEGTAEKALRTLDHGNMNIVTYLSVETMRLNKRIEFIQLEGSLQELRMGLQMLLGVPVNKVLSDTEQ